MPSWQLRSRSSRSAGILRRHTDVPRVFAPHGATRYPRRGVVCVRCRMHVIAWMDPHRMETMGRTKVVVRAPRRGLAPTDPIIRLRQGRGRSRFGHLEIETIWTKPRDSSSRVFFVCRMMSADVQSFELRSAEQRSNTAIKFLGYIPPLRLILAPHSSLPGYFRVASSWRSVQKCMPEQGLPRCGFQGRRSSTFMTIRPARSISGTASVRIKKNINLALGSAYVEKSRIRIVSRPLHYMRRLRCSDSQRMGLCV